MKRFCKVQVGIVLFSLTVACAKAPEPSTASRTHADNCAGPGPTGNYFCTVSMIQLIASPDLYDGRRVTVDGYVHLDFENNGVYLHKEDSLNGLSRNGLWMDVEKDFDSSKCQDSYALVEGTFMAGLGGHGGLWSGTIRDITRCQRY
jgi:hypothetical protein